MDQESSVRTFRRLSTFGERWGLSDLYWWIIIGGGALLLVLLFVIALCCCVRSAKKKGSERAREEARRIQEEQRRILLQRQAREQELQQQAALNSTYAPPHLPSVSQGYSSNNLNLKPTSAYSVAAPPPVPVKPPPFYTTEEDRDSRAVHERIEMLRHRAELSEGHEGQSVLMEHGRRDYNGQEYTSSSQPYSQQPLYGQTSVANPVPAGYNIREQYNQPVHENGQVSGQGTYDKRSQQGYGQQYQPAGEYHNGPSEYNPDYSYHQQTQAAVPPVERKVRATSDGSIEF